MHEYSPQWTANLFDDYSGKEWQRLVKKLTQ
ncbi:hypothetical protein Riv7116_0710 [Rivularia sp. PCC 7116]|nr:hypothetical protein Riv7116_0710 [Rivularia sp. PCC 7116]